MNLNACDLDASHYDGVPNVSLTHWGRFRKEFSPRFTSVLDRYDAGLPECFLPLARGVAVVGTGSYLDRQLQCINEDPFVETNEGFWSHNPLVVRLFDDARPKLWSVERWVNDDSEIEFDEILVHTFGAIPIFANSPRTAKRLCIHSQLKGPPPGTLWFKAPHNRELLNQHIEFARVRQTFEQLCD
jgi:hypothetical protein